MGTTIPVIFTWFKLIIEEIKLGVFTRLCVPVYCPANDNATSSDADDDDTDLFHKIWSLHRTVPLFLIAILGPIACIRSPTFFMKFNSLGMS